MTRIPLTGRQRLVFEYVRDYIAQHGVAPTYDEMGKHFGRTLGTLHGSIEQIVAKGWLVRNGEPRSQRNLALAPDGTIAADVERVARDLDERADSALTPGTELFLRECADRLRDVAKRARAS